MEGAGGEHGVRVPHLRGVPAAGRNVSYLFSFRIASCVRVCRRVGETLGTFASALGRGVRLHTATRASHVPVGDTPSAPRDRVIPRIDRRLPTGRDGVVSGPPVHRYRRPERQRRGCEEASADGARQASGRHGRVVVAPRRNSPAPGNHVVRSGWCSTSAGPRGQPTTPGARATTIASFPGSVPTAPVRGT